VSVNDYHSDPMEITSTLWIPYVTELWNQQEEMHSNYTDLSNVAWDIFSITAHGVGVEGSFALRRDINGGWQPIPQVRPFVKKS